ncbi:MAG: hypothetical protein ACE5I1_01310 [bacterium]
MKKIIFFLILATFALAFIGFQMKSPQRKTENETAAQQIRRSRQLMYVYPDEGPYAADYKQYVDDLKNRLRFLSVQAVPASMADTIKVSSPLYLLGTPERNPLMVKLLSKLPLSFAKKGFTFHGTKYAQPEDVITLTVRYPGSFTRYLNIITGNDDKHILAFLRRGRRRIQQTGDYSILRGGKILTYGFLERPKQGMATVSQEVNFVSGKGRVHTGEYFVVDYSGQNIDRDALQTFLSEQRELVRQQMRQIDFPETQKSKLLPIHLLLYETTERKTIATRDSRLSSWKPGEEEIHLVFNKSIKGDDYAAIAEYVSWKWAGEIPNANISTAAGILFSHNWGREGYPVWAGRFYFNGFFIPFNELFTKNERTGVSKYITGPELATFLQFILFHDGANSLKTLLRNTPASLNAAGINKRFSPRLQDAWQTWCKNMLQNTPLEPIPKSEAFQKGFCYAHEGYAVYNGYMGSTSESALDRLSELGANSISITPFGYPRSVSEPTPVRKSTGLGSENDESVIVSAHFARKHGMRIMLKPHLWAGRSWPGDIKMANDGDWPQFFAHYEDWITHYALLAQMCQFESFVVGLELVQASVGHEDAWRKIIAKIRKIYSGELIYAANWGQEFENLTFWDALDAIGVNCYYPLSKNTNALDDDLQKGARKNMRQIEHIAKKYNKPVIITEIGFASRPNTWINPHVDGRGQNPDAEAQRRCYEAIFQTFYHQPWLQGIYWWKWPTYLEDGGTHHSGFTPNRKPAEEIIAKWYRK